MDLKLMKKAAGFHCLNEVTRKVIPNMSEQLVFVKEIDGISYYFFEPRIGKWYYTDYPEYKKHTILHNFRMFLEYVQVGYKIIYMMESRKVLGYIVCVNGGSRLKCSNTDDIVLGPIYIFSEQRGRGIGTRAINATLNKLGIEYNYCYEYIKPSNIASIRTVEKNGFVKIGMASESGLTRRIQILDKNSTKIGKYIVFRYKN